MQVEKQTSCYMAADCTAKRDLQVLSLDAVSLRWMCGWWDETRSL